MKAIIRSAENTGTGVQVPVDIYDNSNILVTSYTTQLGMGPQLSGTMTGKQITDLVINDVIAFATTQSWTLNLNDFYAIGLSPLSIPEANSLISNMVAKSFSNPSRTIGTGFQISTTRDCLVTYSVRIANVLTLTGGAANDIVLQYADNSGFTTNLVEVSRGGNSNTGGLVVGLTLNDAICVPISGVIPPGKYVRLVAANVTGTPTNTVVRTQEVLM